MNLVGTTYQTSVRLFINPDTKVICNIIFRHAEIDRAVKEKEASLASLKDAYSEREHSLQNSMRELQSQLEDRQIELRQLQWANEDLIKNRDLQIDK